MTKKHFIDIADRLVRLRFILPDYEWRQVKSELRSFCATYGKNFSGQTFDNYIEDKVRQHQNEYPNMKVS